MSPKVNVGTPKCTGNVCLQGGRWEGDRAGERKEESEKVRIDRWNQRKIQRVGVLSLLKCGHNKMSTKQEFLSGKEEDERDRER